MKMKMRTALIGVSGYGARHYLDLMREVEQGNALASAACIINPAEVPEKVARLRELGCRIYGGVGEMFAAEKGRLDLVQIPTGIATHRPFTEMALAAGAHVLVEKPAAATPEDVEAMLVEEQKVDRRVFVGFQHRYDPLTRDLQNMLCSGALGTVREVIVTGGWPRSLAYYGRNNWAGKLRLGDEQVNDAPFNNAFAHDVLTALWFASPGAGRAASPQSVAAELWRAYDIESCDTAFLEIQTDGAPVRLGFSHLSEARTDPRIQVIGEEGSLTWTHEHAILRDRNGNVSQWNCLQGEELRAAMYRHIRDAIQGNPEGGPVCSLKLAACQTRAAALALRHPIRQIDPLQVRRLPAEDGCERLVWTEVDGRLRNMDASATPNQTQ